MFKLNSLTLFRHFLCSSETKSTISSLRSSSTKLDVTMKKLIDTQQYEQALNLFYQQLGFRTDASVTMALKACTKLSDYKRGMNIQQQISSHSLNNPFIQTSLIHFYMQCHDVENANRLFSIIPNKSNYIYGAMFKGFLSNKMPNKVLDLLDEMLIKPDQVTVTLVFNACTEVCDNRAKKIGTKLLDQMPNHFLNDNILLTSAIQMVMEFGDVTHAERLFETSKKNIVICSAMMKGYTQNNMSEKALDLFEEMHLAPVDATYTIVFSACAQVADDRAKKIGKKLLEQMPQNLRNDNMTLNSVIHMLMKFGDVRCAEQVFDLIRKKHIVNYGTMMNGYNINDEPLTSLKLFEEIKQEDIIPNEIIFTSLIGACSQIAMFSKCQYIVDQIPLDFYNDKRMCNSLIDMWGKVGAIKNAEKIFQSIFTPNVITYTAMINAYGINGMGLDAIELYRKMPSNLQNEVSYICVLNACSHAGLLDQARLIYNEIIIKTEQITTVMIDCLSRLFLFAEAEQMVNNYEKLHSPCLTMYMVMLSGARNARDAILSQKIYNRMKSLFPDKKENLIAASILLSNTYLSIGEYEQAQDIRSNRIKELGKKVQAGLSWTAVTGEVVYFKAHDQSNPRSSEIYAEIDRMSAELTAHGHNYDSSWITRPLEAGETVESVLCGHSEKLAIAFNFIQKPVPSVIQVAKNLRVCGDCHSATKAIAKIRQCEIIVRDANRIHHFYPNGTCSCQDHF